MQAPLKSLMGKTIRWTFEDGPTAGKTYEHVFNEDGSVDYSPVIDNKKDSTTHEDQSALVQIDEDVFVASYRGASGYTLTVVLNTGTNKMTGFASTKKQWFQQQGEFEIVDAWHPENLITPQPLV